MDGIIIIWNTFFKGVYGGKNKIYFDDDGNTISYDEKRKKDLENNLNNAEINNVDYTRKYQNKLLINKEEDEIKEK